MYLFHFIVFLNPDFNCSNSLLSFSTDKVTMGTYNLQSVISNFALVGELIAAAGGSLCLPFISKPLGLYLFLVFL